MVSSKVKVIFILAAMMFFVISGVARADDPEPEPRTVSAWEEHFPANPIYSDWPATVRQTIALGSLTPPGLDAVGLTYLPASNHLLVVDSEIEEVPTSYQGVNLWELSLQGALQDTGTTVPRTDEAVGLTVNAFNNHLFAVSDSEETIFEIDAGADGAYFTSDDVYSSFSTNPLPTLPDDLDAEDAEGVAYNPWRGTLYIIDDKPPLPGEIEREPSVLIELDPGPNGVFDGIAPDGDDTTTQMVLDDVDPDPLDIVDIRGAEDIAFNHNSGTLYITDSRANFILEITTDGVLVRRIRINEPVPAPKNVVRADGLAYAPSSSDPLVYSLYVADRGADANVDPTPDGKVVEFSLPGITAGNDAPSVDAGPDQNVQLPNSATLAGMVTDDGVPAQFTVATYWRLISGPAAVTFADDTDPGTAVSFTQPGTYVLRLTASDFELSAYDEVTITVQTDPDNDQPTVNAGPDQTIEFPAEATLTGSASDDGVPGPLTVTWSKVSGLGSVTFDDSSALQTTVSFSEPGVYVLRLTADDGALTASDEVTITVNPGEPQPFRILLPTIATNG
jgi:hypothetical protein